jgi:hypothetical protein
MPDTLIVVGEVIARNSIAVIGEQEWYNGFWGSVLVSVIGAFVGVSGAIWLYFWAEKLNKEKQERQRVNLKTELVRTFEQNLGKIKQLQNDFSNNVIGWVPSYNVDMTVLENTVHQTYEIFNDVALCDTVGQVRYDLSHLSDKISLLTNVSMSSGVRSPAAITIRESVKIHLPEIEKLIVSAIKELNDSSQKKKKKD